MDRTQLAFDFPIISILKVTQGIPYDQGEIVRRNFKEGILYLLLAFAKR
jgi:hypothetical protein